jgi:FkbM family methyltransferase
MAQNRGASWVLKAVVGPFARALAMARLRYLPINHSSDSALSKFESRFWPNLFRDYPSVFQNFGFQFKKVVTLPSGQRMRLSVRDRVQQQIVFRGVWEPLLTQTVDLLLKPGDTFLDVGANVGYFTLLGASRVGPLGRVYAFEPSIQALPSLLHHIEMNGVENVVLSSFALSDVSGLAELHHAAATNIGETSLRKPDATTGTTQTVITQRLDDILAGIDAAPAFVKMDIEGAELLALRGMRGLLEAHHPSLVCEVFEPLLAGLGGSVRELEDFMKGLGYSLHVAKRVNNTIRWIPADTVVGRDDKVDVLFTVEPPPGIEGLSAPA